jgi:hypothetical protein
MLFLQEGLWSIKLVNEERDIGAGFAGAIINDRALAKNLSS